MDNPNILMTALQHAAAFMALQEAGHLVGEVVIKEEIKNAYKNIKDKLFDLFHEKPEAKVALEQFEKQPEVWRKPLETAILEVKAHTNKDLIQCAEKLISSINAENLAISKYQINNHGAMQGSAFGDNASITNHF